jgi:hypothetical protein
MNRTTRWALGILPMVLLGCVGTEADADGDLAAEAEEVSVREGDYDLRRDHGGGHPYTAVAVSGARAFLAKGWEGIHVLDLRTMRVTERLRNDRAGRRLVASGMQSLGRSGILLWHQGNSTTDFDDTRQYLHLSWLSPSSMRLSRTLSIDLTGTYESRTGPLHQLPSLDAHFDSASGRMWLSFNHLERPDRVMSFSLPPSGVTVARLDALPNLQSFAVENPHSVVVSSGTAWVPSSSQGLRAVDLATGRARRVMEGLGYAVQIAVQGDRGFVADHDGALRVVDLGTGEALASREVPGFVDGLSLVGRNVWVVWRNGVTVLRNRW